MPAPIDEQSQSETWSSQGWSVLKNMGYYIFVSLIALCLFGLAIIGSFFVGLYSLWQRAFSSPSVNRAAEDYQYNPEQTGFQLAMSYVTSLFKFLLFPLYVCGLGFKVWIGLHIYPITLRDSNDDLNYKNFELDNEALLSIYHVEKCFIDMPGHARLKTYEFTPKRLQGDRNNIPHIIYFTGNGSRFENMIKTMCIDADSLDATVIGFHHSNFGFSGLPGSDGQLTSVFPRSQSELIEEGVAQVQRLLDKGVPPQKIVLCGHSLGGGIATLVAWHFYQRNQPITINLYNDRSFASIAQIVSGWLEATISEDSPSSLQTILKAFKPTIQWILNCADWNLNAGEVIHKLPDNTWDYRTIRQDNSSAAFIDDEIIPYTASIAQIPEVIAAVEKQAQSLQDKESAQKQHHFYKSEDDNIQVSTKNNVLTMTFFSSNKCHMVSPFFLLNHGKQKANEHFASFVNKATVDTSGVSFN